MYEELTEQARSAAGGLLEAARLEKGSLMVVGCSSSEVLGKRIGSGSSLEAARAILAGILPVILSPRQEAPLPRQPIRPFALPARWSGSRPEREWILAIRSSGCIWPRQRFRYGWKSVGLAKPIWSVPEPAPASSAGNEPFTMHGCSSRDDSVKGKTARLCLALCQGD